MVAVVAAGKVNSGEMDLILTLRQRQRQRIMMVLEVLVIGRETTAGEEIGLGLEEGMIILGGVGVEVMEAVDNKVATVGEVVIGMMVVATVEGEGMIVLKGLVIGTVSNKVVTVRGLVIGMIEVGMEVAKGHLNQGLIKGILLKTRYSGSDKVPTVITLIHWANIFYKKEMKYFDTCTA